MNNRIFASGAIRALAVAIAAAAGFGCNKLDGLTGTHLARTPVSVAPQATGGQATEQPATAGSSDAALTGDEASVAAAYARFTFESCPQGDCVEKLSAAAGVKDTTDKGGYYVRFNPRAGKNPDPVWLPGWDTLPTRASSNDAKKVYEALAVAASMKTWQVRCHADYAKLHERLVADDANLEAAIAKARAEPNPYLRLDALVALRPAGALKDLDFETALAKIVGGRYLLELAILDAFRTTGREPIYFIIDGLVAPDEILARGRPRSELAIERENYCSLALESGTSITPPPYLGRSEFLGSGQVKSPVDAARVAQFTATRAQIRADNQKTFAPTTPYNRSSRVEAETDSAKSLTHIVTDSRVKSTKRTGDRLVVVLDGVFESTYDYDCRTNGYTLDDIGVRHPIVFCSHGKRVVNRTVTITFADVPETTTPAPGDHLDFFGTSTGSVEKTLLTTGPLTKVQQTLSFAGLHLVGVRH